MKNLVLLALVLTSALCYEVKDKIIEHPEQIEHIEDSPRVTTAPISHIEIQTCRYCKAGHIDSVLKFIKYDVPHYGKRITIDYKRKF